MTKDEQNDSSASAPFEILGEKPAARSTKIILAHEDGIIADGSAIGAEQGAFENLANENIIDGAAKDNTDRSKREIREADTKVVHKPVPKTNLQGKRSNLASCCWLYAIGLLLLMVISPRIAYARTMLVYQIVQRLNLQGEAKRQALLDLGSAIQSAGDVSLARNFCKELLLQPNNSKNLSKDQSAKLAWLMADYFALSKDHNFARSLYQLSINDWQEGDVGAGLYSPFAGPGLTPGHKCFMLNDAAINSEEAGDYKSALMFEMESVKSAAAVENWINTPGQRVRLGRIAYYFNCLHDFKQAAETANTAATMQSNAPDEEINAQLKYAQDSLKKQSKDEKPPSYTHFRG